MKMLLLGVLEKLCKELTEAEVLSVSEYFYREFIVVRTWKISQAFWVTSTDNESFGLGYGRCLCGCW